MATQPLPAIPSEMLQCFSASVQQLLQDGRWPAAEQRVIRALPQQDIPTRQACTLAMAEIYASAGDLAHARSWIRRFEASDRYTLRAAHLAHRLGEYLTAVDLMDIARSHNECLSPADTLMAAQSALMAAERMRLPRGRNAAWQRHLRLLHRCAEWLDRLPPTCTDSGLTSDAKRTHQRVADLTRPKR